MKQVKQQNTKLRTPAFIPEHPAVAVVVALSGWPICLKPNLCRMAYNTSRLLCRALAGSTAWRVLACIKNACLDATGHQA